MSFMFMTLFSSHRQKHSWKPTPHLSTVLSRLRKQSSNVINLSPGFMHSSRCVFWVDCRPSRTAVSSSVWALITVNAKHINELLACFLFPKKSISISKSYVQNVHKFLVNYMTDLADNFILLYISLWKSSVLVSLCHVITIHYHEY